MGGWGRGGGGGVATVRELQNFQYGAKMQKVSHFSILNQTKYGWLHSPPQQDTQTQAVFSGDLLLLIPLPQNSRRAKGVEIIGRNWTRGHYSVSWLIVAEVFAVEACGTHLRVAPHYCSLAPWDVNHPQPPSRGIQLSSGLWGQIPPSLQPLRPYGLIYPNGSEPLERFLSFSGH